MAKAADMNFPDF